MHAPGLRGAAEWRRSFVRLRTSGLGRRRLGGVPALTSRCRDPEYEAGRDEDDDRRYAGDEPRGRNSDESSVRGRDQIGHDQVTPSGGPRGHAGRVKVGIKLRLQDTDGGDVGIAHAPPPVELGDVLALANGSIWRVVSLIDLYGLGNVTRVVDMLCMVEPA